MIQQSANERFCHNCGAPNPPDHIFCVRCGARINFLRPLPGAGMYPQVARPPGDYPVRLDIDYPARLSRLSTFFRVILAIPLAIFVTILGGSASFVAPGMSFSFGLINFVLLAYAIAVLLRGRPPRWMFDTITAIQRFLLRANTYFILMTDRYPPFEGDWPVHYEVDYPQRISRLQLLFWKTMMSIPHFIVLSVISIVVGILTFIAWFAILFTGRYPQGFYTLTTGWMRWYSRVGAYWMSLTDEFPPYSLDVQAARGGRTSYALSAVAGCALTAGMIGAIVALFAVPPQTEEAFVAYEDVLKFEHSDTLKASGMEIQIVGATDSYEFYDGFFEPEFGDRFVSFNLEVRNVTGGQFAWVSENDLRLKDSEGDGHDPTLVSLAGLQPPRRLREGDLGAIIAVFEIPLFAEPAELTYSPAFGGSFAFGERARFKFNGSEASAPSPRARVPSPTVAPRTYDIAVSVDFGRAAPQGAPVEVGGLQIGPIEVEDPHPSRGRAPLSDRAPAPGARYVAFYLPIRTLTRSTFPSRPTIST